MSNEQIFNKKTMSAADIAKQPLLVHLVFHPESEPARALAKQLHIALNGDPVLHGLRIPTVFCRENPQFTPPDEQPFDQAERNFVVILADTELNLVESWCEFAADLWHCCEGSSHRCLPVQLTEDAWPLSPQRLGSVNFIRGFGLDPAAQFTFVAQRLIIELCRYLHGDPFGGQKAQAPTKLFISHTKLDIAKPPQVVDALKAYLQADQPIKTWFDSADIPGGASFSREIARGVEDASLLCVLTDNYASREWCRREILLAKQHHRPVVVINALSGIEPRAFPYLGNTPVISWRDNPQAAIDLILKETLRQLHTHCQLKHWQSENDVIFTSPPELATLSAVDAAASVLYPEPPLGNEEIAILNRMGVVVTTPLQRLAQQRQLKEKTVVLSMSESTDCLNYGVDKLHLDSAMLEVSRYLLVQGVTLAYGGHLGSGGYTDVLAELVRTHNQFADVSAVERIVNYVGWPIPFDKALQAQYKYTAKLCRVERPDDVDEQLHVDFVSEPSFFDAATSPVHRYAWARGMTAMREWATRQSDARIVLGGTFGPTVKTIANGEQKQSWYAGRIPGLLEETMSSILAGKPVFVLGGFGGVAAMLVDILAGKDRHELQWGYQSQAPHSVSMRELYRQQGINWLGYDEMVQIIREKGICGINPLLSEAEHQLLFYSQDPLLISRLLIKGLAALP